ncbi:MAG: MarR family transcriptional regulator [Acidimicrobiales bacterium]
MSLQTNSCPSGDEKVQLFGLLLETNARLSRSLGLELEAQCELPLPWFDVLLQLRRSPEGRLKMNEIADAIVHSSGGTTRLIDRIEEAGYVARQSCPSDRRAIHARRVNPSRPRPSPRVRRRAPAACHRPNPSR